MEVLVLGGKSKGGGGDRDREGGRERERDGLAGAENGESGAGGGAVM